MSVTHLDWGTDFLDWNTTLILTHCVTSNKLLNLSMLFFFFRPVFKNDFLYNYFIQTFGVWMVENQVKNILHKINSS